MEGNQMKMREALEHASYFLRRHHMGAVYAPDGETLIYCEDVAKIVDAALSAPPRNCDVGTAEEQNARFVTWRYSNPLRTELGLDALAWAQMPYEAEESTRQKS